MSEFFDTLDDYLGAADSVEQIQVVARRLWYYDFDDAPLLLWDGQGLLTTHDDLEWYGSVVEGGVNLHKAPVIKDGRDGSSASFSSTLQIPDLPNQPAYELYEAIKAERSVVKGRSLTCYLAIFHREEGLRPQTPYIFLKGLTMQSATFNESFDMIDGSAVRRYSVSIQSRDGNTGRSRKPSRTYADTIQKEYARQLGVTVDKGSEYLAALADRTYVLP